MKKKHTGMGPSDKGQALGQISCLQLTIELVHFKHVEEDTSKLSITDICAVPE